MRNPERTYVNNTKAKAGFAVDSVAYQKKSVKVSILMSVYNGAETLAKALDSLLVQTFSEFELIVCDDASTDQSWQILQEYGDKDARIVSFQNPKNLGLGASLNRCLLRSSGEFIARQDADDYSAPDRLERCLQYLEETKMPYIGCGVYIFDDSGIWSQRCFPEHVDRHIIAQRNPFFHPTMIFRREVLEKIGGYSEADVTRRTEDYNLVMRLAAENIIGQNMQEYLYYVYEPPDAYLRHTFKTRMNEVRVRFDGLRRMKSPLRDYIYLCKPVIMALIPRSVLRTVKTIQWKKQ